MMGLCFWEQWSSGILSCDWDQSCNGQACGHMGQHRHHGGPESGENANCKKAYRCKLCFFRIHSIYLFRCRIYTYSRIICSSGPFAFHDHGGRGFKTSNQNRYHHLPEATGHAVPRTESWTVQSKTLYRHFPELKKNWCLSII